MKQIFITILCAFVFTARLTCQTTVDYLTGTANVSIPVYTLKGYTMDFPVTLNYNTGGIKVNDIATWAGLGWNLNAAGAITREVHGLPDETRTLPGLNLEPWEGGYLQANDIAVQQEYTGEYNSSVVPYTGQGPQQTILPVASAVQPNHISNILKGRMDLEPDLFQINAPGLSVKFVFGVDDKLTPSAVNPYYYEYAYEDGLTVDHDPIICIPQQEIKITYTRTLNEITSFTVINLDGVKYVFDKIQRVRMISQSEGAPASNGSQYVASWMLTSITNANFQIEAEFTYTDNAESSELRYYEESRVSHCDGEIQYTGESFDSSPDPFNGVGPCDCSEPFMRSMSVNRMAYVRLSSIETINGKIEIFRDEAQREDLPGDYAIDKIEFTNELEQIISYCKFNHGYFLATDQGSGYANFHQPEDFKRLKLNSIAYFSQDDENLQMTTSFVYSPFGLPSRNSYRQDHWGYSNNEPNESLSCQYDFGHEYSGVGPNREAGGMGCHLEKIIYPDDGFQRFEFEDHVYSKIENQAITPYAEPLSAILVTESWWLQGGCIENESTQYSTGSGFTVESDQHVRLKYSFEITAYNLITPAECALLGLNSSNTFFNKKLIIQGVTNPSIQIIRNVCSDESPWETEESIFLEEGAYNIYWVFNRNGYINYNIQCEAKIYHYDFPENPVLTERVAGGLRLKNIVTSDGDADDSNDMVSRFEYTSIADPGLSSGVLLSRPSYITTIFDHTDKYNQLGMYTGPNSYNSVADANYFFNCNYTLRTSSSVEPLQTENGAFVLYEHVKVFSEESSQSRGYTTYRYEFEDIPDNAGLMSGMTLSRSWRNTALREIKTFNSDDQLISSVTYDYVSSDMQVIWGYQVNKTGNSGWTEYSVFGVDHSQLQQAINKAVLELLKTGINAALSYGNTFGLLSCAVTAVIQTIELIILLRIQQFNPQAEYNYDDGEIIDHGIGTSFNYVTEHYTLNKISSRQYMPGTLGDFQEVVQDIPVYHFDALPKVYSSTSNGLAPYNFTETTEKFSSDYVVNNAMLGSSNPMIQALAMMKQRGIKSQPVETIQYGKNEFGEKFITGGKIQTYKLQNGLIVPHEVYTLDITNRSYAENAFMASFVSNNNVFFMEKLYRLVTTYTAWDENGLPIEIQPRHGTTHSVIRDYADGRVVASIANARHSKCLYNSFETENQFGMTYNQANVAEDVETWRGHEMASAKTGNKLLKITETNYLTLEIPSGSYTLSFWRKNDDVEVSLSADGTQTAAFTELDDKAWTYMEYQIANNSAAPQTLSIQTDYSLSWIDELRLYPKDAMMSTTTYNADGTTHDHCDHNNRCEFIGYSKEKRPLWVMDDNYQFRASLVKDRPAWISRIMLQDDAVIEDVLDGPLNSPDIITTAYFQDGLGRISQSQALKQSPSGKDIISATFFDRFGEVNTQYLPYTRNYQNELFVSDFLTHQAAFYTTQPQIAYTDFPFAQMKKGDYPGAPVIEAGNVGVHWQLDGDHTVSRQFEFNGVDEVLHFVIPNVVASQQYLLNEGLEVSAMNPDGSKRYWPKNTLLKVKSTDENGVLTVTFVDSYGRIVLKRNYMHAQFNQQGLVTSDQTNGIGNASSALTQYDVDTYYVYDGFGHLRYEISPEFSRRLFNSGNLRFGVLPNLPNYGLFNQLGYYWQYDYRSNLVIKKSPGTAPVYMVYDDIGQMVLTQDAKQRTSDKWSFFKYDVFGRPIYQGIQTITESFANLQLMYYDDPETIEINDDGHNFVCYESYDTSPNNVFNYSRQNGPSEVNAFGEEEILGVTYYDHHQFVPTGCEFLGDWSLTSRTRGRVTASLTKVMEMENTWLGSATYFDRFGRPVQLVETNILNGYDRFNYYYNWRGQLLKTTQEQVAQQGSVPLLIEQEYGFDRMGRPLYHQQKTGNDPSVMLAGYEYNELGQCIRKHLHIPQGNNTGMQTVNYQYNERGWLRKINNPNLVDDGVNMEDYDVFGLELHYTPEDWLSGENKYTGSPLLPVGQYNGNLAAIVWNAKNPDDNGTKIPEKTYVYRYDDLYRLTCGAYGEESHDLPTYGIFTKGINNFLEKASYNLNGDIVRMQRYRASNDPVPVPALMDDLVYEYAMVGHRVTSVQDNSSMASSMFFPQFINNASAMMEYYYDELGNCVEDWNKKLAYEYNDIGLMNKATHNEYPDPVHFVYDARGNRLSQTQGDVTTYYISGAEYTYTSEGLQLQHIQTAEGLVRPVAENENNTTTFVYDYFLRDHLGSVRVIITEGNATDEYEVATMELDVATAEESDFEYLPFSRTAISFDYPSTSSTGSNISRLNVANLQGPANLTSVLTGDEIAASVQSWYANNGDNNSLTELEDIVAAMLSGLLTQGAGIVDETTLINYAGAGGTGSAPLSNFLDPLVDAADMSLPQGFLIYVFFDEFLNINSQYSGMIQVGEPGSLEMLQSQAISIPTNGYFYTYLTNYSDNLVSFDNLTIRRKNGVVRAVKEYYPYGLEYGRFNGSFAYNAVDMYNKGYTSATWHELEWKYEGLDLNYFAARYYDPIIGRWHAPDPLEQCHSPYAGMVNDPANFVDPDGRFGVHLMSLASASSPIVMIQSGVTLASTGLSVMGGIMNFVSTCAGIVAGIRASTTTAQLVDSGFDFEKVGNWGIAPKSNTSRSNAVEADWHDENGTTVSDEGDNIYSLIDYVQSTFKTSIEMDGNLWNNGNYQGAGMHSYQLYNTYKNYGGKDASLRVDEVKIPNFALNALEVKNAISIIESKLEQLFYAECNASLSIGPQVTLAPSPTGVQLLPYSNMTNSLKLNLGSRIIRGISVNNRSGANYTDLSDQKMTQGIGLSLGIIALDYNREMTNGINVQNKVKFSSFRGIMCTEYNFSTNELFIGSAPSASWAFGMGAEVGFQFGFKFSFP